MRAPDSADHTITRSTTDQRKKGVPFGERAARLPAIERVVSDEYDTTLAYVMSVISAWAYADEKALAAKLRYYGIEGARVRRITVENHALLVVSTAYLIQSATGSVGVLVFRGTDPSSFVTVLADGDVMQRPFRGGGVHSGFHANVEAVWDDVSEALDAARQGEHIGEDGQRTRLDGRMEALYVTGHSLGGAMAVLAAARLFGTGYEAWDPRQLVRGVYTFGQPMVGDARFAETCDNEFGKKLFRHVYADDVVPRLPPVSALEYAHAGREWRSSAVDQPWKQAAETSRRAPIAEALVEVGLSALELRLTPRRRLHGLSIDDHSPANYLDVSRFTVDPSSVAAPKSPRRPLLPLAGIRLEVAEALTKAARVVRGANGVA